MRRRQRVLVLGVGAMAREYLRACQLLSVDAVFVGKSESGMNNFEQSTGILPKRRIEDVEPKDFDGVIIAVNENALSEVLLTVLQRGFSRVLVEKPGGSSIDSFSVLAKEVHQYDAQIYVAYNRRFYATVEKLLALAEEDGGIRSIHFDFTERVKQVAALSIDESIKGDWFFQNSTHLIDLVLYLAPNAVFDANRSSGGLEWHPRASTFSGSGSNPDGIHLTYNSVWGPSGGWEITARSQTKRFALKPLEKLELKYANNELKVFVEEELAEVGGKPGLAKMLRAFLSDGFGDRRLVTWGEQTANAVKYKSILDGTALS